MGQMSLVAQIWCLRQQQAGGPAQIQLGAGEGVCHGLDLPMLGEGAWEFDPGGGWSLLPCCQISHLWGAPWARCNGSVGHIQSTGWRLSTHALRCPFSPYSYFSTFNHSQVWNPVLLFAACNSFKTFFH